MSEESSRKNFDFTLSDITLSDIPPLDAAEAVPEEAVPAGEAPAQASGSPLPEEAGESAESAEAAPAPEEGDDGAAPADEAPAEPEAQEEENPFLPEDENIDVGDEEAEPRRRGGAVALLVIIGLLVIAAAAALFLYKDMYIVLQSELGAGLPDASYYMRNGGSAAYEGSPEISLKEEDFYLLTVVTDKGSRKVGLLVRDDAAPAAEDARLSVVYGQRLNPCDVLTTVYDASSWVSRWVQAPDYDKIGTQVVSVELQDACGNTCTIPATLEITAPVRSCTWPIGESRPEVSDFLVNPDDNAWFDESYSSVDWESPGSYPLTVYVNGLAYETELTLTQN